ncbi:MAG: ABC transporter permease [Bacilli bacterium]
MFLAWNEIKKNKLRFTLIIGILMLMSYLVFFLSGLANGLASLNREAIDKWEASGIILTEESDRSLGQSSMKVDDLKNIEAEDTAVIGSINAIASLDDKKINVAIFGIEKDEFIMPDVMEGKIFKNTNEVVASDVLKEEGFKIGDELSLSSTDEKLTIVGFTENARFNAAPVLYSDLKTVHKIKYGSAADQNDAQINGIVIRGENVAKAAKDKDLANIPIETFIENLPGYTEQSLTLNFMIYFLFVIAAVIVAIFLYVLTVQKISMFGVLKAQGISNGYLSRSVVAQTFLLAFIGVAVGFVLTIITGLFLPSAVPVRFDIVTMVLYGVVFIVVAVFGALISVRTIVKVDPLKAIGG